MTLDRRTIRLAALRLLGSALTASGRFVHRPPSASAAVEAGRSLRILLIRPDHLGIGLDVDDRSRSTGAERLWALGPLTKGRYWEIVAVPDIREQAAAVAEDIARELEA